MRLNLWFLFIFGTRRKAQNCIHGHIVDAYNVRQVAGVQLLLSTLPVICNYAAVALHQFGKIQIEVPCPLCHIGTHRQLFKPLPKALLACLVSQLE
uniref:Putative secreted protein n=1 Tax=Anopheles darlingi TaxID=43151 RepID=A0A2M4DRE2_ANODA